MKITWKALVPFLLPMLVASVALSQAASAPAAGFQKFLVRFEDAISRFINGDPVQWKQIASRRDDVTIMGAWGAYEKGWPEVGARYDWAAARFRESGARVEVEYLASSVSGDLAYTIAIERSAVRVSGQDEAAPMALRVTHLFRRENGEWRLIHRHADPLLTKTAPAATLQTDRTPRE